MKYVALLRGINVGGNNKVPMTQLKVCFENMGFTNISTYINSGNVIFNTAIATESKLVTMIETGIEETFGFPVRVVVRTAANIAEVAASIPDHWENNAEQKTDILFLWDAYQNKKSLALLPTNPDVDTVRYIDGAIVWHIDRAHYNKSGMHDFIGTELYKNMTARNVNTLRKLVGLLE